LGGFAGSPRQPAARRPPRPGSFAGSPARRNDRPERIKLLKKNLYFSIIILKINYTYLWACFKIQINFRPALEITNGMNKMATGAEQINAGQAGGMPLVDRTRIYRHSGQGGFKV
jgi:hypothetical protein